MGKQLALICVLSLYAAGCTSSSSGDDVELVKGFNPPPVADGYTRYVLPAVLQLRPGEDKMFCQWIALANDADIDMVDVTGYQSVTGHHAIVYSTSETETVGTSRECTTQDMISVEFLGGIGGEGNTDAAKLPDGYVFRHRKQRMLLANAHYLNATDSVQDVQSVLDIKTAPPSADRIPVGMIAVNNLDFTIPANTPSYTLDAYCSWPQDTTLVMWSNHMHANGLSAMSEIKHPDGTIQKLATDASWRAEEAFNPTWTHFDPASPMKIKAGEQAHLQCTWQNNTSSPIQFPDEMCDAVGMYTESPAQIVCDAAPL
jgi:hypothetical protein